MKKNILNLIFILFAFSALAQTNNPLPKYVYIVRHGEKGTGKDPELTVTGKQRAGDLMRVLKKKNITAIYVTQFRRTQMTGDSLRLQMNIDTVHYVADTLGVDLENKIRARHDKNILIIAHSNTVPFIIHKLGNSALLVKEIPETEFDNLFILKIKKGKAKLKAKKYGQASDVKKLQ